MKLSEDNRAFGESCDDRSVCHQRSTSSSQGSPKVWTPDEISTLRLAVEAGLSDTEIGKRLGRTSHAIGAKRKKLGMWKYTTTAIPMPADFEKNAHLSIRAQVNIYGYSDHTIMRWRRQLGIRGHKRALIETPADLAAKAPTMTLSNLIAHYGIGAEPMKRMLGALGIKPMQYKRWNKVGPQRAPDTVLDETLPARAGRFLQKYMPVYRRSTVDEKADRDLWQVGGIVLSSADLIAKAQAKGWAA